MLRIVLSGNTCIIDGQHSSLISFIKSFKVSGIAPVAQSTSNTDLRRRQKRGFRKKSRCLQTYKLGFARI